MSNCVKALYIAMSLMFFMAPNAGADPRVEMYEQSADYYYECMEEHDDEDYCDTRGSWISIPVFAFLCGLVYCLEQRKNFQLYSAATRRKHPYVSLRERPDDIYRYTLFAGLAIGFGIEEVYYGTMRLVGFY